MMTPTEALLLHQQLCDELHELALAENSFLQQHRRAPDADLLDRKRALLTRLDETLAALRGVTAAPANNAFRTALEKTRSRILQVLQLDRENEQLLLRFSLASRPATAPATATPSPSMLQKIYQRHG
jgi:hypothetical protein